MSDCREDPRAQELKQQLKPLPRFTEIAPSVKRTRRFEVEVYATAQELEDAMARVMAALDDLSPTCGTADMDYWRRGQ